MKRVGLGLLGVAVCILVLLGQSGDPARAQAKGDNPGLYVISQIEGDQQPHESLIGFDTQSASMARPASLRGGGPRISDSLLRCDPDRVKGVWNAPKETEVPT